MAELQASDRSLEGPPDTVSGGHTPGHDWRVVTVSGFDLPGAMREVFHDVGMQHETLVRCDANAHPPYATELLLMEGLNGTPLTRDTVKQLWHRAPYVMPFRLVRYAPGSRSPEILDLAAIGTRGDQAEYLARVERIFAHLVEDALVGTSRGQAELSVDPGRTAPQRSYRSGYFDYVIAKWHLRLFSERWSVGLTTTPVTNILSAGATGAVQWQPADHRNSYLADPFPLPGTDQLLCEEMPLHGGVGRVVALSPDRDGVWRTSSVVLDTGQHHSYPCTVKDGARTYFLPEATNGAGPRSTSLRATRSPDRSARWRSDVGLRIPPCSSTTIVIGSRARIWTSARMTICASSTPISPKGPGGRIGAPRSRLIFAAQGRPGRCSVSEPPCSGPGRIARAPTVPRWSFTA